MKKVGVLAVCAFITQVSFSQPVRDPSPPLIKILSWNIYMLPSLISAHNGPRAEAIGKYLAESDYDIIVFQEAFSPGARHKLGNALSGRYPYQAGPANQKLVSFKINSGIWILSRYPIRDIQSIKFRNKQGIDALSRKGALLVEVEIGGQLVQVVGTHLQNAGAVWLRHAQCVEVFERLLKPNEKPGTPQIICGDFNINKNESAGSYSFMLSTLNANDGDVAGDCQFTFDRQGNDLHVEHGDGQDLIDYILVRNNGAWFNCFDRKIHAVKTRWHPHHIDLSDHYSVEASLSFSSLSDALSSR